jgi:hypothetical protein
MPETTFVYIPPTEDSLLSYWINLGLISVVIEDNDQLKLWISGEPEPLILGWKQSKILKSYLAGCNQLAEFDTQRGHLSCAS